MNHHWMTTLRDLVLSAPTGAAAARALLAPGNGSGQPPSALRARADFLRRAWADCPGTVEDLRATLIRHAVEAVSRETREEPSGIRSLFEELGRGRIPDEFPLEDRKRQHVMLFQGFRHLEAVTHINPWSEATSRAGRIFSNLTPAPFVLHGVRFASAESFLQSMRISPETRCPSRAVVGAMSASEARTEGRRARTENGIATGLSDPVWLWGRENDGPVERRSRDFEEVMTEGILAKVRAHPEAAAALAACGDLPVIHYLRGRGRYRLREKSHLPVCLPEVHRALRGELPEVDGEAIGFWLAPTCAEVDLNEERGWR